MDIEHQLSDRQVRCELCGKPLGPIEACLYSVCQDCINLQRRAAMGDVNAARELEALELASMEEDWNEIGRAHTDRN